MHSHPDNKKDVQRITELWDASSQFEDEDWADANQLEKYRDKITELRKAERNREQLRVYRVPQKPKAVSFSVKALSSVIAAFIALIAVIYVAQYLKQEALQKAAHHHVRNLIVEEASTKPGQQVSLQFADGTKAILNSASSLKYSINEEGVRNISLQGEAYFTVVHSDAHPFVVHTDNGTVRDIGTEFDVKAWPTDRNLRVAVIKGIVSVKPSGRERMPIILTANQYSVVTADSVLIPPTNTEDPGRFIAWMDGDFAFHDALVSRVLTQIWRTYGIHCFVSDSTVLMKRITTSFSIHDPAKRVIDVVALSLHLQCRTSRDSVFFVSARTLPKYERKELNNKYSPPHQGQVNE